MTDEIEESESGQTPVPEVQTRQPWTKKKKLIIITAILSVLILAGGATFYVLIPAILRQAGKERLSRQWAEWFVANAPLPIFGSQLVQSFRSKTRLDSQLTERLASEGRQGLKYLIPGLTDKEDRVRDYCSYAFSKLPDSCKSLAFEKLKELLAENTDDDVKLDIRFAIVGLGPLDGSIPGIVIESLLHPSEEVQKHTGGLLKYIAKEWPEPERKAMLFGPYLNKEGLTYAQELHIKNAYRYFRPNSPAGIEPLVDLAIERPLVDMPRTIFDYMLWDLHSCTMTVFSNRVKNFDLTGEKTRHAALKILDLILDTFETSQFNEETLNVLENELAAVHDIINAIEDKNDRTGFDSGDSLKRQRNLRECIALEVLRARNMAYISEPESAAEFPGEAYLSILPKENYLRGRAANPMQILDRVDNTFLNMLKPNEEIPATRGGIIAAEIEVRDFPEPFPRIEIYLPPDQSEGKVVFSYKGKFYRGGNWEAIDKYLRIYTEFMTKKARKE